MSSAYIQPADYAAFGIAEATDAQVAAASRLVDAYLGTTSGLLWSPDAAGNPGWMTGKTATRSYALAAPTTPGTGTQITITGAAFGAGDAGQAVVLDRANPNSAETCVIASATGGTLTLESTAFTHPTGATVEYGLTVSEEARVGRDGMLRIGARPIARLLSLYGNRVYGVANLRDASPEVLFATNYNLSALWGGFPLTQCDLDPVTGWAWMLPGGIAPYGAGSRVRISYIAGWNYANLPAAIQQAVANAVLSGLETGMNGNWKTLKDGDGMIERFQSGALDADAMALLAPYRSIRI